MSEFGGLWKHENTAHRGGGNVYRRTMAAHFPRGKPVHCIERRKLSNLIICTYTLSLFLSHTHTHPPHHTHAHTHTHARTHTYIHTHTHTHTHTITGLVYATFFKAVYTTLKTKRGRDRNL